MSIIYTTQDIISELKERFGNNYDYSCVVYTGQNNPLKIECPIHGYFTVKRKCLLQCKSRSTLCPYCHKDITNNRLRKPIDAFIEEATSIHNNLYDYSFVEYKNNKTKIKIICPTHGEFTQTPKDHIRGKGCFKCAVDDMRINNSYGTLGFINKSIQKHKDRFLYDKVDYINEDSMVTITCREHGEFTVRASTHLYKNSRGGCPKCRMSHGEHLVEYILVKYKYSYIYNYSFPDCVNIRPLPFDFVIFQNGYVKGIIEYDGIQHFKNIRFSKNDKHTLEGTIKKDLLKNSYCKVHSIPLLRIPYNTPDSEIEDLVLDFLVKNKNACELN